LHRKHCRVLCDIYDFLELWVHLYAGTHSLQEEPPYSYRWFQGNRPFHQEDDGAILWFYRGDNPVDTDMSSIHIYSHASATDLNMEVFFQYDTGKVNDIWSTKRTCSNSPERGQRYLLNKHRPYLDHFVLRRWESDGRPVSHSETRKENGSSSSLLRGKAQVLDSAVHGRFCPIKQQR
jgi:hypothetical protein